MAFSNISVLLASNVGKFKTEMAVAGASVYGLGKATIGAMNSVQQAGTAIAASAAAMATAFTGLAAVSVAAAAGLETAINNVATVWDEAGQKMNGTFVDLADASRQIIDLSSKLPQSATTLAEGLYDVASSGFQGSEGMVVLEAAATAASAGLTDTATAGRAITAVLNAYGQSAGGAAAVSDTMFQIVNKGVVTFADLSQNMGQIAPLASAAGVSFADAGAAFAAMTLSGLPAAEAATALSGVIRGLVDPSEEMSAQLAELGHASGTAALGSLGLKGTLDQLTTATQGQSDAWVALFPDIRAATGAMAATSDAGAILADVNAAVGDSAGATQAALGKQSESLNYQMTTLKNAIAGLSIEFGTTLLPVVKLVAGGIEKFVMVLNMIPDSAKTALHILGGLVVVMLALTVAYVGHLVTSAAFTLATNLATKALMSMGYAAASTTRFVLAFAAALKVAAAAYGAVVVGLMVVVDAMAKAEARADALTAAMSKGIDTSTYEGTAEQIDKVSGALDQANAANQKYQGAGGGVKAFFAGIYQFATPAANSIADLDAEQKKYNSTLEEAKGRQAIYNDNLSSFAATSGMARQDIEALAEANSIDLYGGYTKVTKALKDAQYQTSAMGVAAANATANTAALAKTLQGMFDPKAAYTKGVEAMETTQEATTDTFKKELDRRHDIESAALDESQRLQDVAADKAAAARKSALTTRQAAELAALDVENKAFLAAMDLRFRAESLALDAELELRKEAQDIEFRAQTEAQDREFRSQSEALDRQLRAEQHALDERLALLDDEYDKRKKAEDRRWATEQDDIQAMIDSTFGAEREGWKEKLIVQEGAHDDILNGLDRAQDSEAIVLKDGLADQQQILKDGLADQQQIFANALTDRQNIEAVALAAELGLVKQNQTDRQAAERAGAVALHEVRVAGVGARHTAEQAALDEDLRILGVALDQQQARAKTSLENRQKDEDDAADTRRTNSAAKHTLTLAQLQTQLDDEKKLYDQFNADLAIIASRGGADVLAAVAELDPAIVGQAARAGPEALNALLESLRAGLARTGVIARPVDQNIRGIGGTNTAANGAIFYAAGGMEHHVAQIAAGGSWRVWAEPETGGEAYIPLARSKRARSTSILAQVAEQFGGSLMMANGGILGGGTGGGATVITFAPNISVLTRVAADVDVGKVHALVGAEVHTQVAGAFGDLARQVTAKAWRN